MKDLVSAEADEVKSLDLPDEHLILCSICHAKLIICEVAANPDSDIQASCNCGIWNFTFRYRNTAFFRSREVAVRAEHPWGMSAGGATLSEAAANIVP